MRFVCVNKLGEEEISVLVSLAYFCTYLGLDSGQRATGFVWPFTSAHTIDRRTHEILKIKYSTTTQKKKRFRGYDEGYEKVSGKYQCYM